VCCRQRLRHGCLSLCADKSSGAFQTLLTASSMALRRRQQAQDPESNCLRANSHTQSSFVVGHLLMATQTLRPMQQAFLDSTETTSTHSMRRRSAKVTLIPHRTACIDTVAMQRPSRSRSSRKHLRCFASRLLLRIVAVLACLILVVSLTLDMSCCPRAMPVLGVPQRCVVGLSLLCPPFFVQVVAEAATACLPRLHTLMRLCNHDDHES
jgi:hypothetical protein